MLNELKTLSDSIHNIGISVENWDEKLKEIKTTSPCFVISLSATGTITDIRKLDANKAKVLRTWQGGSLGSTFPAFNFQPFYTFLSGEGKGTGPSPKEKASAIANLMRLLHESETLPDVEEPLEKKERLNADKKTAKCLGKKCADEFFARVCVNAEEGDGLVRFRDAFRRFMPSGSSVELFNEKLLAYLRQIPNLESDATIDILVGKGDVVLFFDVADMNLGAIASESTMKTINGRLLATKRRVSTSKSRKRIDKVATPEIDAFGKELTADVSGEKLPEVKLPSVLANTKLRSMAKDKKCQTRYGLIDAESYPVGAEIRKAAKAALEWIASQEREGATWAVAGSGELVFAYPRRLPSSPPKLARLLGNGQRAATKEKAATDDAEARFEKYAAEALKGLKTLSQGPAPNTEIEVFAIKKADKARRKIVFYRNYSLERLENAVNDWNEGARNLPSIELLRWPVPPKGERLPKGTKPVPLEFHAPLPLSIIDLAYANWSQNGNEKFEPKFKVAPLYDNLPVFDGLELFLGNPPQTCLAQRLLSILLQNSLSLTAEVGNLAHKRAAVENRYAANHLETALPLVGILLHKLSHTKESYMENTPYLIGRFLNLADGLHKVWCKNVKKDDPLPPQLLGSTYFASFQQNPVQAFDAMRHRIIPYWSWAETNRTTDIKLSRWLRKEMGIIAQSIHEAGIPRFLSDADRAEMLLGYLAYSEKSDSDELASSDSTDSSSANV